MQYHSNFQDSHHYLQKTPIDKAWLCSRGIKADNMDKETHPLRSNGTELSLSTVWARSLIHMKIHCYCEREKRKEWRDGQTV